MGGAGAVLGALQAIASARPEGQRRRLPRHRREHAERHRAAPLRRDHHLRRQDRRGAQHRRRGPPGHGRRHRARRRGRPRPDRRRRHAHRRAARRARHPNLRCHGQRRRRTRPGRRRRRPRRRGRLADAAARRAPQGPRLLGRRHRQHQRRALGRHAGRRCLPPGSSCPTASAGRTSTSPAPPSTRASRTATPPRAAPARPFARSCSSPRTSPPAACKRGPTRRICSEPGGAVTGRWPTSGKMLPGRPIAPRIGTRESASKERPVSNSPYDIVVLGGGSGGYACALRAVELGMSVLLVEKDKLGGTCLNRGCIPTKALLHAAEVADQTREAATFGIKARFEGIDLPGVHAYKDKVVSTTVKGLTGLIKSKGITIVEGEGRLTGPTQVRVGDTTYEGRHIVLATGSVPQVTARPGHRRRAGHLQRPRAHARPHPALRRRPRRRRDRRRVRQRLAFLRRRGDDRRGAAAPAAAGGGDQLQAARARLPQARHQVRAGRTLRERQAHRLGRHRHAGGRQDPRRRAACSSPSAAAPSPATSASRRPASRPSAASSRSTSTAVPASPTISAVGDLIPTLQLAHVGFAEGILVAERLGGLEPAADRLRRRPSHHLLRARGRLGGHHLRRPPRSAGSRRLRSPTTWPATPRARSWARRARSR